MQKQRILCKKHRSESYTNAFPKIGEGGLRSKTDEDEHFQSLDCRVLAAARSQNGSGVINVIHYRFAASLRRPLLDTLF